MNRSNNAFNLAYLYSLCTLYASFFKFCQKDAKLYDLIIIVFLSLVK